MLPVCFGACLAAYSSHPSHPPLNTAPIHPPLPSPLQHQAQPTKNPTIHATIQPTHPGNLNSSLPPSPSLLTAPQETGVNSPHASSIICIHIAPLHLSSAIHIANKKKRPYSISLSLSIVQIKTRSSCIPFLSLSFSQTPKHDCKKFLSPPENRRRKRNDKVKVRKPA